MSDGSDPVAWRSAVSAEIADIDGRVADIDGATSAQPKLEAELRAGEARRRADREAAIVLLGAPVRRVAICAGAKERATVRPKRCPGCGEPVVDPRGLAASEIAERLGADDGWLAREDGLVARRECIPLVHARGRRTELAWGATLLFAFVLGACAAAIVTTPEDVPSACAISPAR